VGDAVIVCEVEPAPLPPTGDAAGIDLGLECFATLSTGERIANPRAITRSAGTRSAEKTLKTAQRRVSRRRKGSQRRRKARVLLAKAHLKVKRVRLDFCHKVARELIERFDTVHVEKLNIRGMLKNHPLAKSISDAGWALFLNILRAKAASAGRTVVEVNPAIAQRAPGRKPVRTAVSGFPRSCRNAGTPVRIAAPGCIGTTTPL
jgi:putative transposase